MINSNFRNFGTFYASAENYADIFVENYNKALKQQAFQNFGGGAL